MTLIAVGIFPKSDLSTLKRRGKEEQQILGTNMMILVKEHSRYLLRQMRILESLHLNVSQGPRIHNFDLCSETPMLF